MSPKLLAVLLGATGGLLLGAAGGLSFVVHGSPGWQGALVLVGYAATVAALLVMGYGLVASAPIWLRMIVSMAFPLLVASVWQVIDQTMDARIHGWKGPASVHLLAGIIVVVSAWIGFGRSRDRRPAYQPTHR